MALADSAPDFYVGGHGAIFGFGGAAPRTREGAHGLAREHYHVLPGDDLRDSQRNPEEERY